MLSPKANLEMNKEGLAADLVCMLDERSLPRNKARLQELIERFFIAGAARIDLIAKVIDLDNDIGGYKFDIANLQETANEIENIRRSQGKSECLYQALFVPKFMQSLAILSHLVKTKIVIFENGISKLSVMHVHFGQFPSS